MTLRVGAAWLPSALLLLQVPGSWSLSGPRTVKGTVGGSLSVQCQYEEEFTGHVKYWCKYPSSPLMKIVETTTSEREVRRGRVSIRDHPENLTFTVTLDSLTEEDEGTYVCGINIWGRDPTFQVKVSVFPVSTGGNPEKPRKTPPSDKGEDDRMGSEVLRPPSSRCSPNNSFLTVSPEIPSPKISTSSLSPPSSLLATTWPSTTRQVTSDPSQRPRSLFSSVHFLLRVFVELPLFLSMLSAVLWVNRPQRSSGERRGQPDCENQ